MKVLFFAGTGKTRNTLILIVAVLKGTIAWIFIFCESSPMTNEFHVLYWPLI